MSIFEWFFEGVCYGLGRFVRWIFRMPPAEKGNAETITGLGIIFSIAAVIGLLLLLG